MRVAFAFEMASWVGISGQVRANKGGISEPFCQIFFTYLDEERVIVPVIFSFRNSILSRQQPS